MRLLSARGMVRRMTKPFKGTINVDDRDSVPDWEPYVQPVAPPGAPSVLYIVLDDVGFSAMEPWGGLVETPNINQLATHGLTYTNWHTTALCSPTRSSLLTGRNHTTNGMACIAEATTGFPNSNGHIPFECATIAEVLGERGWNTYMVGKWHLTAEDEMNLASRKTQWPGGRGLERVYGFLGAETNQWYPDLVYDNHPVEQPKLPEDRYHLTTDITDKAIEHPRRESRRPRQALLPLLRAGRGACPTPRAEGVGRQVQGPLRHGVREVPRARLREPEEARDPARARRALADQPVHRSQERRRRALARAGHGPPVGVARRRRKRSANSQGRTADPMIVSWPKEITSSGIRPQYTHAI